MNFGSKSWKATARMGTSLDRPAYGGTMKTSELLPPALDWAVTQAEGLTIKEIEPQAVRILDAGFVRLWQPTLLWAQAGPIIEREWLQLTPWPNESDENQRWHCVQHDAPVQCHAYGPTPLVAAMRCFVASKLGDEVEVPKELL
jgi:hypothetical protein